MTHDDSLICSLTKSICGKIQEGAKKTKALYSAPYNYRVPEDLRKLNESAYVPRLIAIGPVHRGDEHLQTHMQDVKMLYTNSLLGRVAKDKNEKDRKKAQTVKKCVAKILKECVKEAKKNNPEEVPLVDKAKNDGEAMAKKAEEEKANKADEDLVEMMLVDGCFILELLYSSFHGKPNKEAGDGGDSKASGSSPQPTNEGEQGSKSSSQNGKIDDPIHGRILTENIIKHDLLLLENQIPFSVLKCLFEFTVKQIPESKLSLTDYVLHYFGNIMRLYEDSEKKTCSPPDCVILLVNKIDSYCFRKETESEKEVSGKGDQKYHHILHFLHEHHSPGGKLRTGVRPTSPWLCWQSTPPVGEPFRESTPPVGEPIPKYPRKFNELEILATDLDYAGVKFVSGKGKNLFDIKFEPPKCPFWLFRRARFEIPTLDIHGPTETFLRNLIAMEQCCPGVGRYFTCYAKFFDKLINSQEDVKVLTKARVIRNHLGEEKDVSDLFNKLCKEIVMPGDFIFNDQCQRAYGYSQCPWPKYRAQLRRNYFEVPWSFIGFCVALIVFGITVTNFIHEFLK